MKLSHFNYDLPEGLLAEYPSEHRDEAKLMVLHRDTEKIEHKTFKDLVDYFDEGDILVFLPGIGEIRRCQSALESAAKSLGFGLIPFTANSH